MCGRILADKTPARKLAGHPGRGFDRVGSVLTDDEAFEFRLDPRLH
jgi:hypothetical protein